MCRRINARAAVAHAAQRVGGRTIGIEQNRSVPGIRDCRAGIFLLRDAVVSGRTLFRRIEHGTRSRTEHAGHAGSGVRIGVTYRRVQIPVHRVAVRVAERVG